MRRCSFKYRIADCAARTLLLLSISAQVNAQTSGSSLFQRQQQLQPQLQQPQMQQSSGSDTPYGNCPEGTPSIECVASQQDEDQQPIGDVSPRLQGRRSLPPTTFGNLPGERVSEPKWQQPSMPAHVKEPPTEFQRFVQASTGHLLPIYGTALFDRAPSTFAPSQIAGNPDYTVGAGDQIDLRVWGQVNFSQRFTVNPTGDIFLPQVGRISVVGVKVTQLQDVVRSALSRIYRNFDLNVNMGQLRSMQIFVLGQARQPGAYTVSSLSTLVNALFASGGPSSRGSLRSISLKRGTRTAATLDLYDLLLHGDKTADVQLMPGDVIFIPDAGPRVAIEGSIESPAIFELKNDTSLGELFSYAGGLSPVASGQRAILERVDDRSKLHSEDIQLSSQGLAARLQNGDIIRVLSVVPQFSRTVTLRGNVADPVRFPWHAGLKISELIPAKEALLTRGFWRQHNELLPPDEQTPVDDGNGFQVIKATTAEKAADVSRSFREESRNTNGDASLAAAISAAPNFTIRQFIRRNDVQLMAPDIYWSYASIERLDSRDLRTRIIPFNLGKVVLEHDPSADMVLEPGDIITIFSEADITVPRMQQTKYVRIEGEVRMAGVYSVLPGETLRDIVARAGGLTLNAYLFGAQFTRESTRREQQRRYNDFLDQLDRDVSQSAATLSGRVISADQALTSQSSLASQRNLIEHLRQTPATGRIVLDLQPDSTGLNPIPDLPLENGDRLFIPSRPSTVDVVGMVYNQAAFIYNSDYRLAEYLGDAGGPSRYADRSRIFVIRADGSVISKETRSGLFAGRFESLRMYPGDTLVVPNNVNKTSLRRGLLDWSQIISSFGIGAAAVNVLK